MQGLPLKQVLTHNPVRIASAITETLDSTRFKGAALTMTWRPDLGGVLVQVGTEDMRIVPFANITSAILAAPIVEARSTK